MANLKWRALTNFTVLGAMLICAALAPANCAQTPRHLEVEVGPNQQVRILASGVSYGEVLRALRSKLGWEIEIPPLADELKLTYARVESTQPQTALAKLLEGSRLGYAFLGGANGPRSKVTVIPSSPRDSRAALDTTPSSPIPDNAVPAAAFPLPTQAQAVAAIQPDANSMESVPERPAPLATMPFSEAANALGVPPGLSLSDVGKTMTLPISDAARMMGAPPSTPPGNVGVTITLPLPTGPGNHP